MIDRRLHVLRMVNQHGTVTAAALALHLTPSAVSQQVRALALELDVDLLQPAGRGVRLTATAEILLEHADRLYAEWERTRSALDEHRRGRGGTVRLSGFPSVLAALLPTAAAYLRTQQPDLHLRVVQADPADSLALLLAGGADLAVLEADTDSPATSDQRFEQEWLFDDPLHLVVPAGHRLAERDRITLADAADEDWVAGPAGSSYHQIELLACHRAGFTPRIVHRALDWSAYLAVVEAGLGIALLPRLAIPTTGQLCPLPLSDDPAQTRRLLICVRRGSMDHPAIRQVRDALRHSAAHHASHGTA